MSRYIVNISGVGHSRHDISRRQSIEGKIEKYQSISAIYRQYIGYLPIYRTNIGYKCNRGTKNIKFYNLAAISIDIDDI